MSDPMNAHVTTIRKAVTTMTAIGGPGITSFGRQAVDHAERLAAENAKLREYARVLERKYIRATEIIGPDWKNDLPTVGGLRIECGVADIMDPYPR